MSANSRAIARTAVPLVSMGATWAARKGLMKGYEAKTGKPAPLLSSRDASIVSKVVWAASLAAVLALVEAVIWKLLAEEEEPPAEG